VHIGSPLLVTRRIAGLYPTVVEETVRIVAHLNPACSLYDFLVGGNVLKPAALLERTR
jgi:hypothetical protein